MEIGLLILRLMLAALLAGHALQKLLGWFHGGGLVKMGTVFAAWGHRPGQMMAAIAGVSELLAATLLAVGFLTPLASAIAAGTMFVAGSVSVSKGVWATQGGYELPLVYGLVAIAIAFTGSGRWSLDNAVFGGALSSAGWGAAAAAVAVLSGLAVATRARIVRSGTPQSVS
ncbi:DoxX family protein [Rhodococcus sp. IEGM 248]|nr:DoxX family protein [Rhodococcus sp. IEGM 248]